MASIDGIPLDKYGISPNADPMYRRAVEAEYRENELKARVAELEVKLQQVPKYLQVGKFDAICIDDEEIIGKLDDEAIALYPVGTKLYIKVS